MLDRICVALDGADRAAATLPLAYALARRAGARVTLLHVAERMVEEPVGNDEAIAFDLLGATDDRRWWTRLRGLALTAPPDLEVRAEVVLGEAALEVPSAAEWLAADLVVAGTSTMPGRLGALRGGVARRLLSASPCPVVLVPRSLAPAGQAVLVHTRGDPRGDRRAVATGQRLADALDAPLVRRHAGPGDDVDALLTACHQVQPLVAVTAAPARWKIVGAAARWRRQVADGRARCPVVVVGTRAGGPLVDGAGAAAGRLPGGASWKAMRPHPSLLARIFTVNAAVLVVATLLLIVTPLTVSSSVVLNEVLVVAGGLSVMLAADYVLLRRTLAPLRSMTDLMGTIDPLSPGRRLPTDRGGSSEVAALSDAFNAMLDRLETERRQSARRALAAQEDERVRIARELHDEVGQTLTAITIQAEQAAGMAGEVDRELIGQIAKTALHGVEDVRRIARELRPEALDDLGLVNALIALCSRVAGQSGVRVQRELGQGGVELPALAPEVELVVYRVAQESLTNAVRHADPSTVLVRLQASPGGAQLIVEDDGSGIPADAVEGDTAGLSGMRERAMLIGGTLELYARRGGGTRVRLWVPAP